ncbi:MAG: serine hydrolase [Saprospiraceae bacterium]
MTILRNTFALILITACVSCTATFFLSKLYFKSSHSVIGSNDNEVEAAQSSNCSYKIKRLKGFRFIQPLQSAEPEDEGTNYATIKSQMLGMIESYKNSGIITNASVYLRDFEKGNWMSINSNEVFHPGSLMKLPMLVTYLKMDEVNPGILNKKLILGAKPSGFPDQIYTAKQIEIGKAYTIGELLKYMIQYSDNYATFLLHQHVDKAEYNHTYLGVGLAVPDIYDRNYSISAKAYSTFFKVLYNGGYLSFEHSEYVMELLSNSEFTLGFKAGLPAGTTIVHKFGEWGDGQAVNQLHESGLVYINGSAFLLTVMTSGRDAKKLPEVIAGLTQLFYTTIGQSITPNNSVSMLRSKKM